MKYDSIRVEEDKLRIIINKLLEYTGVLKEDSILITDCMIEADLCGVHTHGVSILGAHIKKIIDKGYNLNPSMKIIKETASFSVLDADNSIGFLSAVHSMEKAIDGAKESGIYTVMTRNSNTYGPAFYYTNIAAERGFIGMTFSNSPSAMAPWGGKEKLLGTNPFAITIPSTDKEKIIFDMATSKVAKSKINLARKNGGEIPSDWALDKEGIPTNDPLKAIEGILLPMAEHKGYGLSMTIDILAGVLSGAAFLDKVERFYSESRNSMNVGQTFIAIDPRIVYGDDFYDVINHYINKIRKSESLSEKSVRIPGDGKTNYKDDSKVHGIALTMETVSELNKWLVEFDIDERI